MKNRYNANDIILVAAFLVLLFLPCVLYLNTLIHHSLPETGEKEQTLKAKIASYETLLTDSLTLKRELISFYYYLKTKVLKESNITPTVIQGSNDWLYYSGYGDGYALESYTGQLILADSTLLKIKHNLEAQERWLRKRNIDFYLIMCPNKQTIYPEYFPYKKGITVADQIMSYLKTNTTLKIIDLREALIKAKTDQHYLYYKTDSHWTSYGGFIGYTEILNQLSINYPELKPVPMSDYKITVEEVSGNDIAEMVNLEQYYKDYKYIFEPVTTKEVSDKKNVLVFRDSFFKSLRPFFANHFTLAERPHQWNSFDYKFIEEVNPEIVFYQVVERYLTAFSRENPAELNEDATVMN
jgi:hypothetical protein